METNTLTMEGGLVMEARSLNSQMPPAISQFLAEYLKSPDSRRATLLAKFLDSPHLFGDGAYHITNTVTGLAATDSHLIIKAIIGDEWIGPSAAAKLALADALCKYPVPAEATFIELYRLYTLLFYRLRHKGIHAYVFGTWDDKENYGSKSPLARALAASVSLDDHHGASILKQARKLLEASEIPGANISELFVMLGHAFTSHMPTATQQPLFGRQFKTFPWSVRTLPNKVAHWVDLRVQFTPSMFRKLVKEHLLEPMEETI